MDNAPYHSVAVADKSTPATSWTKARVIDWLQDKGILECRYLNYLEDFMTTLTGSTNTIY